MPIAGVRVVREWPESLVRVAADEPDRLTSIEGIGRDLAEKIQTLIATGSVPLLEELRAQVPPSVLDLMRIPGLGPKKAAVLQRELGINTLDDLRAACQSHRLRELKGFGAKTEAAIAAGIDLAQTANERIYWATADQFAQELVAHLRTVPTIDQIAVAGSYRRGANRGRPGHSHGGPRRHGRHGSPGRVRGRGGRRPRRHEDDRSAARRIASRSARGAGRIVRRCAAIFHRLEGAQCRAAGPGQESGAEDQRIRRLSGHPRGREVRGRPDRGGRVWNAWPAGFSAGNPQSAVRICLGRGGPAAASGGDGRSQGRSAHAHDGDRWPSHAGGNGRRRATLGFAYIAITDHSKRVSMANGLDETRLRAQWAEIDRLNATLSDLRVLKGVEVDILERGGLDLADDCLCQADWVVASIHYGQNQGREQITARMIGALESPHVSAIAHPTGRLINRRAAYESIWKRCSRPAASTANAWN